MPDTLLEIATPDGTARAWRFSAGRCDAPGILFFMDALGPRDALFGMARRVADAGYDVLLPDIFYRHAPYAPFDPATVFQTPEEFARLRGYVAGLTNAQLRRDIPAYANVLGKGPIGVIGYCLGGRAALVAAACLPDQIAAAASLHGAYLAPEGEDGAHHAASSMTARIYIGVAGIDQGFDAAEEGRLAAALRGAGLDHTIETFGGVHHGFAVDGMPAHDPVAAARAHARVLTLFDETLGATLEAV